MPKGYFLSAHRSPADPEKRAAYLELAGPAMLKAGGKVDTETKMLVGKSQQKVLKKTKKMWPETWRNH